jgi:putative transport protein
MLDLDPGTGAGLFSGAMTNSTSLGTATHATSTLPLDTQTPERLAQNVATTYALTYLSGLMLVLWFLPNVAPRLMRTDLKEASRQYEESHGMSAHASMVNTAYRPIEVRGYRLPSVFDGFTVAEVERQWPPETRAIVARVRRGEALFDAAPSTPLHAGDVIAVAGRSMALIGDTNPLDSNELHDRALLQIPTVSAQIVLTSRALGGLSLRDLAERVGARGIFLIALRRSGLELPFTPTTIIERGDILRVSGSRAEVARVASELGYAEYPTTATDLFAVAATVTVGGLVGLPALTTGGFTLSLTTPVGVLLAGLTLGHLRSKSPRLGRVPDASVQLFELMGLSVFLALVGLQAGPAAIGAIRESGLYLVAAGAVITLVPHIVTIVIGRYLIGMHPSILLGVCAGAGTSTPSLAALERAAQSRVPTMGYGMACAVGNVLTAVGATLLVLAAQ